MDIVDQLRHYPKMVSTDGFRFYKTSDNCATCAEAADTIDSLRAQVAALERSMLDALGGGTCYMDPPDGGDVDIPEQLRRMSQDAKRYRWLRDKARIEDRDGGYTGFYRLPFIDAWDDTPYTASKGRGFHFTDVDAAIDEAMKA